MRYSQLFGLLEEARLSPEQAAGRLGVTGMTLRRWRTRPPGESLPDMYARSFRAAVRQMVVDGELSPDSAEVRGLLQPDELLSFRATLQDLGFSEKTLGDTRNPDALVEGLSHIASPARIKEVEGSRKKISAFAKLGAEWKKRTSGLVAVIGSRDLTAMDKLVAYGALFYLITPFDLIPDTLPVFGLLDDYAILGLALAYYLRRYPRLFKETPRP